MALIEGLTIAANAIAKEAQTNVTARNLVPIPSDDPSIRLYATHNDGKTILCKIAYDGSTTIKVVKWNEK